ncbi:ZER1 [Branchiostoma lanceolatum]|uniref:Protein zer-1 homolog n=1 Tax=Branchiostoma lanceolatum TaxID=7740 RepID=A0A8K0ABL5_BRALA|nr:ZER1 [Branchiostoma lanceolatum]
MRLTDDPESLGDICVQYCLAHLGTFCVLDAAGLPLAIKPDICIPSQYSDKLLNWSNERGDADGPFLRVFLDPQQTRLRHVNLHGNEKISNQALSALRSHQLVELDLSCCPNINADCLQHLSQSKHTLLALNISGNMSFPWPHKDIRLDLPRLRVLNIGNLHGLPLNSLENLALSLSNLTSLDVSGLNVDDLSFLEPLKHNLSSLVLYNCSLKDQAYQMVMSMKALRHLDMSVLPERKTPGKSHLLSKLVHSLPALTSLDISGTSLGDMDSDSGSEDISDTQSGVEAGGGVRTTITGLQGLKQKLDFLGVVQTEAAGAEHIPAHRVAGHMTEQQVLTALQVYLDRSQMLAKCLTALFELLQAVDLQEPLQFVHLVAKAMRRHPKDPNIQVAGSAALYHLTKGWGKSCDYIKLRRITIQALTSGMEHHPTELTMQRNGCLTLCNFRIPEDLEFEYQRVAEVLLRIFTNFRNEEFIQRIAVYLCNIIVCQLKGEQKELVGRIGVVETMLKLIHERLNSKTCNEVMEIAWSTLWNITDETPLNCQMFMDGSGMDLFLSCLETFPDKQELHRNMLGLMGNVAEVKFLRPRLMQERYVTVFNALLESESDGIEVSYNSCGVLSHIMSDGVESWTLSQPCRQQVLERMVQAIERWDIATKRNINYRSFEPILKLLGDHDTPQVQHWAVWALTNLTRVYPDKYVQLLRDEGGIPLLEAILNNPQPYPRVRELVTMVLATCREFEQQELRVENNGRDENN